jgi:hypothetical protein
MVSQVPFFLTWRYYWQLPDLAQSVFEYCVGVGWQRWMASLDKADPVVHARLARLMAGLPEPSRRRFLTAPETYRLLCTPSRRPAATELAFVESSLMAERARLDGETPAALDCWTARGDARFAAAAPGAAGRFEAPTLAAGVVVDSPSPYAYLEANAAGSGEPVATQELAALLPSLADAAGRLREVSQAAYETFRTSISVVTVRRDRRHEAAASSSWPWLIGKMGLANPWAGAGDQRSAALVNALVHESIHSLLYRIELVEPLYASQQAGQDVLAFSPWSGRELRLHSFVHACFVWFGLWCFWRLPAAASVVAPAIVRDLGERAARGFRDPGLRDQLTRLEPHLTAPALTALHRVCEAVAPQVRSA